MIPPNRRRPTDAEVELMRQQVKARLTTVAAIAKTMQLHPKTVGAWLRSAGKPYFKSTRRWPWQDDPQGFDNACLDVVRGNCNTAAVAKAWQCGYRRVSRRIEELCGVKLSNSVARKPRNVQQTIARTEQGRRPAEIAKRERLRLELEALRNQPYRLSA